MAKYDPKTIPPKTAGLVQSKNKCGVCGKTQEYHTLWCPKNPLDICPGCGEFNQPHPHGSNCEIMLDYKAGREISRCPRCRTIFGHAINSTCPLYKSPSEPQTKKRKKQLTHSDVPTVVKPGPQCFLCGKRKSGHAAGCPEAILGICSKFISMSTIPSSTLGRDMYFFHDSGASVSILSYDFYRTLRPSPTLKNDLAIKIIGAGGNNLQVLGTCTMTCKIGMVECSHEFIVCSALRNSSIILGLDFANKIGEHVKAMETKTDTLYTHITIGK